jgi:hypothetical protein
MKLSKQDQKYQATQQLTAKFAPQCNMVHGFRYGLYIEKVDITQLLKKVVK